MKSRSSDFKSYLQEELLLRAKRNPAYSLRSFAKSLGVSPSFLSKVLNGQRRITDQIFQKFAINLNLDPSLISRFINSDSKSFSSEMAFNNLQLEYFKMIADWYHYALIELTNLHGFTNTPNWIASKLGITTTQAKSAVDRLVALGLLELKNGKLRPTSGGNTTVMNEFTDLAFKKMQDDLLKKAIRSLWDESLDKRNHTSISMAIDPADIPEVKKRLAKMRRELCQFLERPNKRKPTQVYNLSLSFFALSKESL